MIANDLNENAIINRMLARGWVSVPILARELDLPNSTVVSVIRRMVERGIIRRGKDMPSKRGRPVATYFPLLPHPVVVCLVDGLTLSAAKIETDLSVGPIRQRTKPSGSEASSWVSEITTLVQSVIGDSKKTEVVLSVYAVEIEGQRLTSSVVPGISEVISRLVAKRLPIRVQWAQWPVLLAAYRHLDDPVPDPMLLLHVADGISAPSIINGSVFRGNSGLAGELGHVVVREDGPPCGCGRNGCLEACCSGPAICKRLLEELRKRVVSPIDPKAFEMLPPSDAIDMIWEHWVAGDEFVRQFMDQIFDQLSWALGLAINLVDPQAVVTAGYVLQHRAAWIEEIERRTLRWVLYASCRKIQFIESPATLANILQTASLQHVYRDQRNSGTQLTDQRPRATISAEQHLQRLLGDVAES